MSRLAGAVRALVHHDDADLYLLIVVAGVTTVLGVSGAPTAWVLSCILALLAFMAFSQLRSRRQVAALVAARDTDPLGRWLRDFPTELEPARNSARDVLLIGVALSRTVQSYRRHLPAVLAAGGRVRVLVMDPAAAAADDVIDGGRQRLAHRVRHTLDDLAEAARGLQGLEIRVIRRRPMATFNVLDPRSPDGMIVVQRHEYLPPAESLPIVALHPSDGAWYQYFLDEAERYWRDGLPWPPPPGSWREPVGTRVFRSRFGDELWEAIPQARAALVTGIARNSLLTAHFHDFERLLRAGYALRFLLLDPDCPAVDVAADRYYAERDPANLRQRIRHSRQLLAELKRVSGGDVRLRWTTYPLAVGLIGLDLDAEPADRGPLFLEYYTHQAPGEPKFVLWPTDPDAYPVFGNEAEIFWSSGRDVPLPED